LPPAGLLFLALATPPALRGATPPELARVHAAQDAAEALTLADALAGDPEAVRLGIDYLRGHLLEILGRTQAAELAFSSAMQRAPLLARHCRYRLARLQLRHHPEVAAGLVAPLLTAESPPTLRHQSAALLRRSIAAGGDCRLLEGIDLALLAPADRRGLEVRRADCVRRERPQVAIDRLA